MKPYLIGIDIGTSGCKIAIFNKQGEVLEAQSGTYPVYYPKPGWAEQDPRDWWDVICQVLPKTLKAAEVSPEEIAGIGIDGQSWSAIAVDAKGNVLTNTPIWMDTRAQSICEEMNEKIGSKKIFELCGNSLQPSYTTPKILWYQRNLPEVYEKTAKILQSNSYIAFKLTGNMTQDVSQGYGLHCFDMRQRIWNEEMCQAFGFSKDLLPDIYACHEVIGTVTEEAAGACGLCVGIPVVAGGLDAACGALGVGVLHDGDTQEQGGQAGGMSICMGQYCADERLILGTHVVPGCWLLQGGTTGGGGVMRWLEQELGDWEREKGKRRGISSLELMNEEADAVPAGSDGVVFLPYMSGERSPIWDPNAKGVYYGLDFGKKKGHLIRSAMEGTAYALKHNLEVAQEAGANVQVLKAMGGAANSRLWTQIKADVTGKTIEVPSSDTATTLGAAILAGVGVGMYESFEDAVEQTVTKGRVHIPNTEHVDTYEAGYAIYRELYEQLKNLMKKTGGK